MLMKFLSSGGQQAFFDTFYWAITIGNTVAADQGLESPDIPDGTGEFLDAWLMLLEKMVNPKNVLESPHILPNKPSPNFKPFDSLKYLIKTHKKAFEAVMKIWGKKPLAVYGSRMSESVLSILCHIIKGEKVITEKLEKEKPADKEKLAADNTSTTATAGAGSTTSSTAGFTAELTPAEPDVNPEHLQTLMDMGFPRDRCIEAINAVGGTLDAATDYLLNNPLTPLHQSLSSGFGPPGSAGGEQDDLMRAIAMSLGENSVVSEGGAESSAPGADIKEADTNKDEEEDMSTDEQEALKQQVIDTFTDTALSGSTFASFTYFLTITIFRLSDFA